jgi:single-strand DNA-binding protein
MSNEFRGTGNIAVPPTLKTVAVAGQPRKVAELRVFFDDYKPNGEGRFEQRGGFWLDVSVWGDTLAESVAQHLTKGARVHVTGRLAESKWNAPDSGEERRAMQVNADNVFLSLGRIEEVRFRPKRDALETSAA